MYAKAYLKRINSILIHDDADHALRAYWRWRGSKLAGELAIASLTTLRRTDFGEEGCAADHASNPGARDRL